MEQSSEVSEPSPWEEQLRIALLNRYDQELLNQVDPGEVDVFGLLGYTPTPRQAEFHNATEFDVLYGGAAGGGKTRCLLMHGIRAGYRHPALRIGAFRRTYDELAESFLVELAKVDYADVLGCRWNKNDHELTFPNGSVIRFRYLESEKAASRRQGGEYQLVLLDERTLLPPAAVSMIVDERVRSSSLSLPVLGVRSASNPGGPGHGACYDRYIEPTSYGDHAYVDEQGRSVRFIPAKVSDNPHLVAADPAYIRRLDAIADPARRAAMRDGSWDSFGGQFFQQWNRARHVIHPVAIPASWVRYEGIDWGYGAPWAVVWGALDEDGRLFVYREFYEAGVGEKEQARRILAAEGALTDFTLEHDAGLLRRRPVEKIRARLADPSMWARRGDANPIATVYGAEGCHLVKGNNERVNGWQRIHTYLDEGPACPQHREQGWETCPMLHVFDTCIELIKGIKNAPRDKDEPEDIDTDYDHDHDLDALRYLAGALPVPRTGREPARRPSTPDEQFWQTVRAQTSGRRRRARV